MTTFKWADSKSRRIQIYANRRIARLFVSISLVCDCRSTQQIINAFCMYVRKYAHTHTCGCCSRLIMISPYLHLQWGDEKEVWLKIGWDSCGATVESISSSVGGMVRGQIQAVKQNFASSKCNEREIHSDLRLTYWRQVAIPSQQEIV